MESLQPVPGYRRCECSAGVFSYLDGRFRFDLSRITELKWRDEDSLEIEEESVRASLDDVVLDETHIDHVDPSIPGVIATVRIRGNDGEWIEGHVLIDGHHRAARCLRDGLPFRAYVLDAAKSEGLLLPGPALQGGKSATEPEGDLDEETTNAYQRVFAASLPWNHRAREVIAGTTTHDRRGFGPFAVYVDRADGAWKWDVDGRPLIDYWMGHGALLCGHNFGPVVRAVTEQISRGTHYGASHPLEVRWAELVCRLIPSAEKVRFTASGTEATLLAMRIARAFTGRQHIVKFDGHFHGWHDEAMAHFYDPDEAGFNVGTINGNSLAHPTQLADALERISRGDVAGVLLEPAGGSGGGLPWSADFLHALREATKRSGTLLIFDEVISGFRQGVGGVQADCCVRPDLTTLAKILCGGLPGGAVAGRADVMSVFGAGIERGDRLAKVPHTGTFNANPLSAAAGIAMLEHISDGVAQRQAKEAAETLSARVNEAAEDEDVDVFLYTNHSSIYHILIGARAAGIPLGPSEGVPHLMRVNPKRYALLRRALLLEGVDTHPVHGWVSAAHDPDTLERSVEAFARAFRRIRGASGFARQSSQGLAVAGAI